VNSARVAVRNEPVKIEPVKILKRGELNGGTPTVSPRNEVVTSSPSSESTSGCPPSARLSTVAKMNPADNVFFKNLYSLGPSWVPSITSTRNGMDLKEKMNY